MYHSVDGPTPAVKGSHPVSMERFQHQIEALLLSGWQNAPLSRLREPVEGPTFYITADDGTTDWCRNVLPWCERHGLYTHTAVITGPWETPPRYPLAHIVQVALALRPKGELRALAERIVRHLKKDQKAHIEQAYHYESDPVRRVIKGACNLVLPKTEAHRLLHPLSDSEREALEGRFENAAYYKSFHYAEVGPHTVTHRAPDTDVERYFQEEIEPCMNAMREMGLTPSNYFTSPMKPVAGARISPLADRLKEAGFEGILFCCGEWNQRSFIIPRVDAQHVETRLDLEVMTA